MKKTTLIFLMNVSIIFLFAFCNTHGEKVETNQATIDSANGQLTLLSANQKKLEGNKKLVADFYLQLFGDKNVAVIDNYISDTYIQHNPALPDGKDTLKKAATEWFKGAPKEKIDIQHLGADGNFVYIHTKASRGAKIVSVIDIFRIENDKIAEHWDVIQEVPEKSANPHPLF